jgi:hypothetical protein
MKALLLCAAAFLSCCAQPHDTASQQDPAVLTAAVKHFLAQPGSVFGSRDGVVIVNAQTAAERSNSDIGTLSAAFEGHHIAVPQAALSAFFERNRIRQASPVLGDVGARVRVESDAQDPVTTSQSLHQYVQTILDLKMPGYTSDQTTAVLTFDFTWSAMHSGVAYYLLKRSPSNGWVVAASDMDVYL